MKNKIKIVFDANPLAVSNKTGVGMYTLGLIKHLAQQYLDEIELVGYYYNFLGRKKVNLPTATNIIYKPIYFYPGKLVNILRRLGIEIPLEILAKTKADIGLFPNFLTQSSLFKVPLVPVIHDLSFIDLPDFAADRNRKDLTRFLPKMLAKSAGVITVSEVSKRTIANRFKLSPGKILVTHIPPEPAETFSKHDINSTIDKFNIQKPYILFVGTLEPRKNITKLLEAYEQSTYLNANFELVVAGGIDWKFEDTLNKINELKEKGLNIIQTGYVDTRDRNILFMQAKLFVLPSHYEGFGMPILEAFSYKTPVCLSDIEVFHEVAGDAAIYFDQNDPKDIANKLEYVLKNKNDSAELINKGIDKLKEYSWDTICKELFDLLKKD